MPKRKKRTKKPKLSKLSTIDDLVNESIRTSNSLENEINKVINKQKKSKRTKRLNRKLEKLSSQNRKVFKRKLTEKIKRKSKRVKSGGKWGALGLGVVGLGAGLAGVHVAEAYTGGDWGGHDLMSYDHDGDGRISHSEFDDWATSEHSDVFGDGSGNPAGDGSGGEQDERAEYLQQTWDSFVTANPNPTETGHSLLDAAGDGNYTESNPTEDLMPHHYLTGEAIDHFYEEDQPGETFAAADKGYQNVYFDGPELVGATVGALAGAYAGAGSSSAEPKPKKKAKKAKKENTSGSINTSIEVNSAPKGPLYSF